MTFTNTTDEGGGVTYEEAEDQRYPLWAKVEKRSGMVLSGQEAEQWAYDYKITFRYEVSRPVTSDKMIGYDGQVLRINSISFEEGSRKFCIARCSVTRT